ncbi:MAG: hypothetical protein ABL897_16115 [Hyphomicrobium sp.]
MTLKKRLAPVLIAVALSLAAGGCKTSGTSGDFDIASVRLADMPAPVIAAAARGVVAIPDGPLGESGAKALIVKLRRSELRNNRAVRLAIAHYEKQRGYARNRGKKKQ